MVEKTLAAASVVARGNVSCGSAELMVNGCSGSSLFQEPNERKPVSCVRFANLVNPPMLTVCAELDGHSDIRPRPGALVESSARSGLSHTSGSSRLSNHDPLYAMLTIERVFVHSAPSVKSFARES